MIIDDIPSVVMHSMTQQSESWDEIRSGKLTASEFALVLGTNDHKRVRIKSGAAEPEWGRAAMQSVAWRQLIAAGMEGCQVGSLNPSGLKGLREKDLLEEFIDPSGCTLKVEAAKKHIDLLVARKTYTPAELGAFMGTWATDRGDQCEQEARFEFESLTGLDLQTVGFCVREDLPLCGCSPDALVSDGGLWETKAPLPQNHLTILRKQAMPSEYRAQVHGQMAITGRPHVWFMSYCPGLPSFHVKVVRDRYTENLLACLREFEALYLAQLNEYGIDVKTALTK